MRMLSFRDNKNLIACIVFYLLFTYHVFIWKQRKCYPPDDYKLAEMWLNTPKHV